MNNDLGIGTEIATPKERTSWKKEYEASEMEVERLEYELKLSIADRNHHRDLCYKAEESLQASKSSNRKEKERILDLEAAIEMVQIEKYKLQGYVARVREAEMIERVDVDIHLVEAKSGVHSGDVGHGQHGYAGGLVGRPLEGVIRR